MKHVIKLFGAKNLRFLAIAALVALIGFSMAACNPSVSGPTLNGSWTSPGGNTVNISGSTGTYAQLNPSSNTTVWRDAINKGYIRRGERAFQNLVQTGEYTWAGQVRVVTYTSSRPSIATGIDWESCIITLSWNGQSFQVNTGGTYTRR